MSENTKLWDTLGRTDPKQTKAFTRGGGFKGTAIKPMWSYLRMTEEFGPCGKGWGVNHPQFQVVPAGDEVLVYCTVAVWWRDADVKPDNEHDAARIVYGVGGDKVVNKFSSGLKTDDEAFKKAFTDAITNALKMIGVGADVHMGLFDDSKYVNTMKQEFSEEPATRAKADYPHDEAAPPALRDNLKINKQTGRTSANSLKQDKSPDRWEAFEQELAECQNVTELTKLALSWSSISERDIWPTKWHTQAKNMINERREEIINGVVPDDDVFPGDRPTADPRVVSKMMDSYDAHKDDEQRNLYVDNLSAG